MPSVAAMTVAVVQAMPFVVNTQVVRRGVAGERGGAGPGARESPSSPPVISLAVVGEQVVAVAPCEVHQLVGQLVVVLQRVHERRGVDAELERRSRSVSRRNSVSPVTSAWW